MADLSKTGVFDCVVAGFTPESSGRELIGVFAALTGDMIGSSDLTPAQFACAAV
jgi:hypothetical protein